MSATAAARKSTGPTTLEGKARASRNSLRHGLTSAKIVLPHESQEEFDELTRTFAAEWQPGSDWERELLGQMVTCWWRLSRAYRVEAEFFAAREKSIRENGEDGLAGDAALAQMFSDPAESQKFRLFLRYLTAAERAWTAATRAFKTAREERLEREREQDMLQSMLEIAEERRATAQPSTASPESVSKSAIAASLASASAFRPATDRIEQTPEL